MKKLNKKYADLMRKAQQATGRKEAVGLIHKAAKLKSKFDQYEMMQFDIDGQSGKVDKKNLSVFEWILF